MRCSVEGFVVVDHRFIFLSTGFSFHSIMRVLPILLPALSPPPTAVSIRSIVTTPLPSANVVDRVLLDRTADVLALLESPRHATGGEGTYQPDYHHPTSWCALLHPSLPNHLGASFCTQASRHERDILLHVAPSARAPLWRRDEQKSTTHTTPYCIVGAVHYHLTEHVVQCSTQHTAPTTRITLTAQ